MTKSVEERLLESETSIAHLEHRYDQLNQVVIEQGKVIDRLQAQVKRLSETVATEELERIHRDTSKPPHSQV